MRDKEIVEYPLKNGGCIFVEIESEYDMRIGKVVAGATFHEPTKVDMTFDKALENINQAVNSIIEEIGKISCKQSEVRIELGFRFDPRLGAIMTSTETGDNCMIEIKLNPK